MSSPFENPSGGSLPQTYGDPDSFLQQPYYVPVPEDYDAMDLTRESTEDPRSDQPIHSANNQELRPDAPIPVDPTLKPFSPPSSELSSPTSSAGIEQLREQAYPDDATSNGADDASMAEAPTDPPAARIQGNIARGLRIDTLSTPRMLLTAIQQSQDRPKDYGSIRICPIVIWDEGKAGDPDYPIILKHRVMVLTDTATVTEDIEGEWTVPEKVLNRASFDTFDQIVTFAQEAMFGHAEGPEKFFHELVGIYEDEVYGVEGLLVAVLMFQNLWSPFLDVYEKGLSKDEVHNSDETQFDPPVLRQCIIDAFGKF